MFSLNIRRLACVLLLAQPGVVLGDTIARELCITYDSPSLARWGGVEILIDEVDHLLAGLPEGQRGEFLASPDRLGRLLENLAITSQLYQRAVDAEMLSNRPELQMALRHGAVEAIANRYVEEYVEARLLEDYEPRARELWLSRPDSFRSPRLLDFTHLLVDSGSVRGEVEAMERILAIYQEIDAETPLEELARDFSDDPSARDNNGKYERVHPDELDPEVARVLNSLEPGQLSQPVRSSFGWHIVRLDTVHSPRNLDWEEARSMAKRRARSEHRERLTERLFRELLSEPLELVPGALPTLLARYDIEPDEQLSEEAVQEAARDQQP